MFKAGHQQYIKETMLTLEGYDSCISGYADVWHNNERISTVIYSGHELIEQMVHSDGMTPDEAMEYIAFNIEGAYVGSSTPIIMWDYNEDEHDGSLDS